MKPLGLVYLQQLGQAGQFVPPDKALVSAFDHGLLFGDGLYETIGAVGAQLPPLEPHFERMQDGAAQLGLRLPKIQKLEEIVQRVAQSAAQKAGENAPLRLRITLTRGANGFDVGESKQGETLLVFAAKDQKKEEVASASHAETTGLRVVCVPFCRVAPDIKSISMLPAILARRTAQRHNAFEALFTGERGQMLEGSVHFFCARVGQDILAPKPGGALPSIGAQRLQKKAEKAGLRWVHADIFPQKLPKEAEPLLTNALSAPMFVSHIIGTNNEECHFSGRSALTGG